MASWCCRLLCGPVRRVPPWAVYVNHVIMLFRSIDRPSRPALPGWGQEPWGWWVHLHNAVEPGSPSPWRAGVVLLTPAAPRWASERWPFPLASPSDGGRLTASPKPPDRLQTWLLLSGAQISPRLILQTPARHHARSKLSWGANGPLWPLVQNEHKQHEK